MDLEQLPGDSGLSFFINLHQILLGGMESRPAVPHFLGTCINHLCYSVVWNLHSPMCVAVNILLLESKTIVAVAHANNVAEALPFSFHVPSARPVGEPLWRRVTIQSKP